ncbi:hypothetical protein CPB86DRAFT_782083 [Serendipita vermifera]|nr:hypothetical protein CPB86DRAFT_782083 [Serendipita vermifera]
MSSNPTSANSSNSEHGGGAVQGSGQASNSTNVEAGPCRNPSGHQEPSQVDPMQEGQDSILARYESRKGF